ncbi:hypothetical protein [Patulibacter defluvii]|uniref:hypothetical protein n=1 Tax=Patulibacter defluvii TaxID=3095358 RepID=UPI002A74DD8C|nr:hypothetical protein [Patulibacter sp. DM4]
MSTAPSRRRRRPQASTVIASVALFAALSGTATAAGLISGKQIKNSSVTGADIRNSSLTGSDVKNRSLGLADLSTSAVAALKGATGPAGAAGPAGPQGPAGPATPAKVFVTTLGSKNLPANATTDVLEKALPAGAYLVTGKLTLFTQNADIHGCDLRVGGTVVDSVLVQSAAAANARTPVALHGVATIGDGGNVRIACTADNQTAGASQVKLTAVPVGEIG